MFLGTMRAGLLLGEQDNTQVGREHWKRQHLRKMVLLEEGNFLMEGTQDIVLLEVVLLEDIVPAWEPL